MARGNAYPVTGGEVQLFIHFYRLLIPILVSGMAGAAADSGWRYQRTQYGLRSMTAHGRATTPDGEVSATLELSCKEGKGGTIGLDLTVFSPGAANHDRFLESYKSFHFTDFEGPEASAARRALTRVTVLGAGRTLTLGTKQAGWFSSSEQGGFTFGFFGMNDRASNPVRKILRAIANGGHTLRIRITDSRNPEAAIQGDFDTRGMAGMVRQLMDGYWKP